MHSISKPFLCALAATLLLTGCPAPNPGGPDGGGGGNDGGTVTDGGSPGTDGGTTDGGSPPSPWGPGTQIETSTQINGPYFATFSGGRAMAVWEDYTQGLVGSIYGSEYDPTTDTWSAPQRLDDGTVTTLLDLVLHGVTSAGDHAVATWEEWFKSDQATTVVMRRYDPATGFAPQDIVTSDPNNPLTGAEAFGMADNGELIAAWQNANGHVVVNVNDPTTGWGNPAVGDSGDPRSVAVTADGHGVLAYAGVNPNGEPLNEDYLETADYDPAGTLGTAHLLAAEAFSICGLATDGSGGTVAAWHTFVNGSGGPLEYLYTARRAPGGTWSTPGPIDQNPDDAGGVPADPSVVPVTGGVALGWWEQQDPQLDGPIHARISVFTPAGGWSPTVDVGQFEGSNPVDIALTATGGHIAIAAHSNDADGNRTILVARGTASGPTFEPLYLAETIIPPKEMGYSIAIDDAGNAFLGYVVTPGGNQVGPQTLYIARLPAGP